MSQAAATPLPTAAAPVSLKPGQVLIVGRCISAKKNGSLWAHLIVMPAPDPFSSPSTVEVLAKSRQADDVQDVRLLCRVGGYRRSYRSKPDEYGETRNVQTADNKLFLVED